MAKWQWHVTTVTVSSRVLPLLCSPLLSASSYLCLCPVTSVVSDSLQPRPAPLSMGFSRQEHWSGLPFPSPGDLPDPGIQPVSPASVGRFFTAEPPGNPCFIVPSPQSLGNADLLAIYIFFPECHIIGTIQYVVLSDWLFST